MIQERKGNDLAQHPLICECLPHPRYSTGHMQEAVGGPWFLEGKVQGKGEEL